MADKEKTKIKAKDITEDEKTGDAVFPEGYELYKVKTKEDRILERKAQIENDLKDIKEPTTEELIQEGRMMHPYYMMAEELRYLNDELKKLK